MTRSAFKCFVLQDTPWTFSPTSTPSNFKHLERSCKLNKSINLYWPLNWIKLIPCKAKIVRLLRDSLTPTLPSCCPGELIMVDGRDSKLPQFLATRFYGSINLVVKVNSNQGDFQGKIPKIACFLLWCFYPFLLGGSSLSIYDYKSQHCGFEALKHLVDSLLTIYTPLSVKICFLLWKF